MKRLFALVLSAVMLLGCSAAAADNLHTSDFEDFTLNTPVALDYSSFKAAGQPLFVYYRTVTGEISTSAVSAIWLPSVDPVSAEEFTAMLRDAEAAMGAQQASKGNTMKSYEVSEAAETELWGVPVLVCDAEMLVGLANSSITVFQRSIRITGSYGTYIFSLSAFSRKSMEEATDELAAAVQWK